MKLFYQEFLVNFTSLRGQFEITRQRGQIHPVGVALLRTRNSGEFYPVCVVILHGVYLCVQQPYKVER